MAIPIPDGTAYLFKWIPNRTASPLGGGQCSTPRPVLGNLLF